MLHDELLEQARNLATYDPRRPRQGNLRRAVSSAYYAVFHLLIHEASARLVGHPLLGVSAEVNHGVRRWFDHTTMKRVAEWFQGKGTPPALADMTDRTSMSKLPRLVSPQLRDVAATFADLQEQRHMADYDLGAPRLTRQGALNTVERAEQAFKDWQHAQNDPLAQLFLLLLLTGDKIIPKR
ncbi:hypothetical protein WMF31_01885 [Sorangium sp. So ce1036]|uniref:hypothetical protein n=1 Tax=Sorangium sp. So ce1036 TaxID=3133328 RepID=UPI003F0BF19B